MEVHLPLGGSEQTPQGFLPYHLLLALTRPPPPTPLHHCPPLEHGDSGIPHTASHAASTANLQARSGHSSRSPLAASHSNECPGSGLGDLAVQPCPFLFSLLSSSGWLLALSGGVPPRGCLSTSFYLNLPLCTLLPSSQCPGCQSSLAHPVLTQKWFPPIF